MLASRPALHAMRRATRSNAVLWLAVALLIAVTTLTRPAQAMKIEQVKSPGGIEAWLVSDPSVPLLALRFAFEGGSTQDPAGKEGTANFVSGMLDEGAGDLSSSAFQERLEEIAMRMSFEDGKDTFYGNVEMLTVNRDKSVDMLRLALTKPRFDGDAVERVRKQLQASLVYAARDPEKLASKEWLATAFAGHAYGRPANGTPETIAAIKREDLEAYRKRTFAKSNLKVVAVGDIDKAALGKLLDDAFGGLSDKAELTPVPAYKLPATGQQRIVEMPVPQSVAIFGSGAMARKDPDFMAGFILNHILGGGGFASKLMEEVREKRGLAYSVYSYLQPFRHSAIFSGSVATKNESIAQSLDVIRAEMKKMAEQGPSATDLENAKKFLVGSYALRFDTNAKIASQLLAILQEDLGIDYVDKRNALVEAVTIDDLKRVAKSLLRPDGLIVTIVGQPMNMPKGG